MTAETVASTSSPTDVQDFGWALGTLWRAYLKRTSEATADVPGGPRGYLVLSIVASDTCQNQAAIAERLGIDRTVMTYLLDDLEGQGLVLRQPDPVDRRSRQVKLTPDGQSMLQRLTTQVDQVERHILGDLDDDEAELLRTMLGRAARSAESHGSSETACSIAESIDDSCAEPC